MLQFWKKDKQKSPHSSPQRINNGNISTFLEQELRATVGPLSHFKFDYSQDQHPCEPKSRLTLGLEDVLQNKVAILYFSQFMESRSYSNIFNLLMDIEDVPFKPQTVTLKRTQSLTNSPSKVSSVSLAQPEVNSKLTNETILTPKRVFTQYLCDDSPNKVRIPEELKSEIQSACLSDKNEYCFDHLRDYIFQLIKKEVWMDFLRSDWYCKYQIEIMTSGKMTLSDVLYNDPCLECFIEFLEQEGCDSVIEFWREATHFQKQYSSKNEPADSAQIQNDAIIIYDKYLSLQATVPLGLSDRTRFAVEEAICGEEEGTTTSPECLAPGVAEAEAFLRNGCLRLFLSSHQYLGLLSEVMSTSRPPHSSPASSVTEGSLPDVRHPLQEQSDPLWRRRKANSGLSFGRIDPLGRYETEIEPEPGKKSESRISRVVKLILNKDEQKAQEEMAWRVAEMIVKDITSITMGSQSDEDL